MGNGLYGAIGFGCIFEEVEHWQENAAGLPAETHAREVTQRLFGLFDREELANISLRSAEEARPDYLVIPLATTDIAQARRWGVAPLPIESPIPLDELLSSWLAVISPEALAQAQQNWEQLRAAAQAMEINLPPGRLIYISDWE